MCVVVAFLHYHHHYGCCCCSFKIHVFAIEQYPQHICILDWSLFLVWHVTVAYLVACIFIAVSRVVPRSFSFLTELVIFYSCWTRQLFFSWPHASLSPDRWWHSPSDHFKSYWRQTLNRPIKFQLIYVTFQTWAIIHPRDNKKKDSTWIKSDSQFYFYPERIHLCCTLMRYLPLGSSCFTHRFY